MLQYRDIRSGGSDPSNYLSTHNSRLTCSDSSVLTVFADVSDVICGRLCELIAPHKWFDWLLDSKEFDCLHVGNGSFFGFDR